MELFEDQNSIFPTSYTEILQRIRNIDPVKYASTRNYSNGSVTYLSPYISRGIVSTKFILSEVLNRGYGMASFGDLCIHIAISFYQTRV